MSPPGPAPGGGRALTRRQALAAAMVPLLSAVAGCDASGTGRAPVAPPAPGPARAGLVAFGDFGGGAAQAAVAAAMERWAAAHRVDALVTTGDNVYERGEPELFAAQLDEPYRELRRTRPLWATLGNHDVAAGHGATQLRHLGLPDLPYARTLPGLRLLLLDANRVDDAQTGWLDARLAEPGPEAPVVVFHHAAWSCSRHDSNEQVRRAWVPVLERHRVPLVLNGHDHNYQRFVSAGGVTYVVSGGGGRSLYPVDGCAAGAPERVAAHVRHHFTAVEVGDGSLAVTVVADDDTVLDRAVIDL